MSSNQIVATLTELQELKRMQEELAAEIDTLQDALKAHMTETEQDTLTAGGYRVTYKAVTNTRIDTVALRKDLPEVWSEYGKTTTVKRFSVALAK